MLRLLQDSLPGRVARKFVEDEAATQATLIAWSTLLAVFPIVLTAASILGLILHFAGIQGDYRDFLVIIPDARTRAEILDPLRREVGPLAIVALLGLFWSGSALFGTMERAFATIYRTKRRGFVRQKLMSFAMMLIFTVLAGLAVGSSALIPVVEQLPYFPPWLSRGPLALALQAVLGALDGVVLFLVIYKVVPGRRMRVRNVLPGALLAGVLFEAFTLLLPTYIALNKGLNRFGSTLGLLFLLMSYFYFIGLITMFGAELNSVLHPVGLEPGSG
jgi:membrane protein